jgi:hypothetical protein
MNTLGKEITKDFYSEDHQYEDISYMWSKAVQENKKREVAEKNLKPIHYALYAMLRGKDWRKCFTPITNQKELENGVDPVGMFRHVCYTLETYNSEYSFKKYIEPIWGNIITFDGYNKLLQCIPDIWLSSGSDAYKEKELNAKYEEAVGKEVESMESNY